MDRLRLIRLASALALAAACATGAPARPTVEPLGSPRFYDPAIDLGPLFQDVQLSGIFADSKTFVDARARRSPATIASRYAVARNTAGFDLRTFLEEHFTLPRSIGEGGRTDTALSMEAHIRALWPVLIRSPDPPDSGSTLIPLRRAYVVPGGRFREVYYWDSYFTMLGLLASGRADLVRSMLDNFADLIARFGRIPNGNRSYYLSRSQPPYFGAMVGLYATATDTTRALAYLEALEAEHRFWMRGAERLAAGEAAARVVRLHDGAVLNRYWDDRPAPRPESFRQDYALGQSLPEGRREGFFRNIRASAESGWDFSSRWMRDPADLRSLETTELVPVDLNSLLYHTERTVAALRAFRGREGDAAIAERFRRMADARRRSLLAVAYDSTTGFFYDVRWRSGERVTDRPTLAAAAPLYFGLASPAQGQAVAARLEREFLRPGGFVTTLIPSGQQWDAPNGWPPLQWLAIEGVRRYGREDLAAKARDRWLAVNRQIFRATGRMMEKYDLVDLGRPAGGGEYPAQDGFGWTNGVALALAARGAPAQTDRFSPLFRLEAGTLNPRDPFAATFTWGASLGLEWADRRALLVRFTRQQFNDDEDADYSTDARTLITVAGELASAPPNRRKQQLRFRLGGGALLRPGLRTAPVVSAGVAIRYELWPHTSLVGHIEDHAAILPRQDIRGCNTAPPVTGTCRSVIAGGRWLHNFGLIVALEVR